MQQQTVEDRLAISTWQSVGGSLPMPETYECRASKPSSAWRGPLQALSEGGGGGRKNSYATGRCQRCVAHLKMDDWECMLTALHLTRFAVDSVALLTSKLCRQRSRGIHQHWLIQHYKLARINYTKPTQ